MTKRTLIVELPNGSFRKPTLKERQQALADERHRTSLEAQVRELNTQLRSLSQGCPHLVTYDTVGYIFNIRHCLKCGNESLL